jgi:hypothetical protein
MNTVPRNYVVSDLGNDNYSLTDASTEQVVLSKATADEVIDYLIERERADGREPGVGHGDGAILFFPFHQYRRVKWPPPAQRGEDMLRQIWSNNFETLAWKEAFVIDHSLPNAVVESLHPMPAEMKEALDCWRDKMVAAIDEVAQCCKTGVLHQE